MRNAWQTRFEPVGDFYFVCMCTIFFGSLLISTFFLYSLGSLMLLLLLRRACLFCLQRAFCYSIFFFFLIALLCNAHLFSLGFFFAIEQVSAENIFSTAHATQ